MAAREHGSSRAAAVLIFSRQPTAGGRVSTVYTDAVTLHISIKLVSSTVSRYLLPTDNREKHMHDEMVKL